MATIVNETEGTQATEGAESELSLRETLEAAFEKEPTDEIKDTTDASSARDTEPKPATEGTRGTRDAQGRFAKQGEPAATQQPVTQQQPATGNAAPGPVADKDLKAPASWTPGAREEWAALSPRIKSEIHKREWEAQKVVQEGAQHRQFISAFENVIRPYEMFIRAENSNPLQAVQNLMATAANLRVGTPDAKANLIAGLVQQYGIDVSMLDSALDKLLNGRGNGAQAQQVQQYRDPRIDQIIAFQQQQQREAEQRQDADVRSTLSKFSETHEFYSDVAPLMADIVDMRAKRGEPVDLEKVYQQACQMHDEVRSILASRPTTATAQQRTQSGPSPAVLRARRAASSVRNESTPDGATIPKDDSIRAAIEAAMENTGRI